MGRSNSSCRRRDPPTFLRDEAERLSGAVEYMPNGGDEMNCKTDTIFDAIERKLADIEAVIALDNYHGNTEAQKMIARAAKAGRQAAIEYAIAKARGNAGKFVSDEAREAFIEELKK